MDKKEEFTIECLGKDYKNKAEYSEKIPKFLNSLNQLINSVKEEVRNKITTGIVKHIEGHCAWFHIDNQTFLLLENYQDEHITSEDSANWILKCLNTAFDKLRDSKE